MYFKITPKIPYLNTTAVKIKNYTCEVVGDIPQCRQSILSKYITEGEYRTGYIRPDHKECIDDYILKRDLKLFIDKL